MKRCLCVFLKYPTPGYVKTRLAETLGDSAAADIYKRLTCEVLLMARDANPDVISIFFAPSDMEAEVKNWLAPWIRDFPGEVNFHPQSGGNLGDRLSNATEVLFETHPDAAALIIGTDCIEMDRELLTTAWEVLESGKAPVVIGPAADGGYYLIGTRELIPGLYDNIPWSTESVLSATLENAAARLKECFILPEKTDIDTISEYWEFEDRLKKRPCIFFDRDGVVNESPGEGYVLKTEDFHLNDGIAESLKTARDLGYLSIIVTSQKGVGKQLMSEDSLTDIHHNLQNNLAKNSTSFDAIYFYTGSPDCDHKAKPHPAMITAASEDFSIDLNRSWIVGDADRDIEMGINAKLHGTIRIRGPKPILINADHTLDSVLELPKLLRKVL